MARMRPMKIARVHSHLGGLEFMRVRLPGIWAEVESAIRTPGCRIWNADKARTKGEHDGPRSPVQISKGIGTTLNGCGWTEGQYGDSSFSKNRAAVKVWIGRGPNDIYDLFAQHLALYVGDIIDVGIEILPMKELQGQMSSGVAYYEGELYNLIREGRGVPAVPLVLVGIGT